MLFLNGVEIKKIFIFSDNPEMVGVLATRRVLLDDLFSIQVCLV
jgi:hypothetical protein